jgi:hypothetical protein
MNATIKRLLFHLLIAAACAGMAGPSRADEGAPSNLARTARATAFESYQGMTPDLANDGKPQTRWSGVPGHNTGGWYELDWDQPVRVGEVVVFQHDRYVKEMDVEVWDDMGQKWVVLEHLGQPDRRLPLVVASRFQPRLTSRLRLARITNGPSFTEVEVYEEPFAHPPAVSLASDLGGGFIGMVSDHWGGAPVGAGVTLAGSAKTGPWQQRARSDQHGLFFVAMPLGLTGPVSVAVKPTATDAGQSTCTTFDAAGFQYGLTPTSLTRSKTILDGPWRFAPDPPDGFQEAGFDDRAWAEIHVPAHIEMQGFHPLSGVGGYRTRFRAPAGTGRLKLRFEGVYSGAEVWVNGRWVACHEGGALPFEIDVTDVVRARGNVLAVRVSEHTVVSDRLDKMSEYADFPLGGIIRPVSLFRVPWLHIGALDLSCAFDADYRNATLSARVAVLNESDAEGGEAAIDLRLLSLDRSIVAAQGRSGSFKVRPWERAETRLTLPVSAPRHWEAEHPECYLVEAVLRVKGSVPDRVTQKFGFRQTEVRDRQLLINGRPVKIRGTCHHDSHPLLGRAVTEALARQDLELMKEANLNALRTSHYPPHPALIDVADEVGVYIEDEGSFCWADAADDLRLTPRLMQLNAELLARDRNHPSVFVWSVCNESSFGYGFERSHEWLRAADPTRPNAGSYDRGSLEILARHNPITLEGIEDAEKQSKPVLWDECWCIFQGIFGDVGEMWLDPGVRDYYAEPLPAIYARMMRSRRLAGTQIWAWSDDIFCVPGRGLEYGRQATRRHFIEGEYRLPARGLVGDAPWGVVDGWRRKKPEFWIIKKLHSPVKVHEGPLPVPSPDQPLRVEVENQYDFTDLSELTLDWRIGREHGVAHAALRPHQTSQVEIQPRQHPSDGQSLALEFHDRTGRLVDACDLPIGKTMLHPPAVRPPEFAPLQIRRENYLSGAGTRIIGKEFELAFDLETGLLRRGTAGGQALLLETPRLHVLPATTPFSPLPNPLTWRLQKMEVVPDGPNVRVHIEGQYDQFTGKYDLVVTPEGALTTRASFRNEGPKLLAREIGLVFSVPKDCDLLRWERRADWSVYPSDHIGRPQGETRALAAHGEATPPMWAWAADNSSLGCNDFRSTKRRIDWAWIGYPHGPAALVESDGSQHLRAMVADDRIVVHINDWYGGTHAGLWEWTSNYGEGKPIENGQTIESTLRLRFAGPAKHPRQAGAAPASPPGPLGGIR